MVDGGSLENCCAARHRGFESLFLRKAVAKKRNELARLRFFDAGLHSPAAGGEGCRRALARRNPGGRGIRSSRYPIPNPFPRGRGLSRFAPTLINAPPQAGGMSEGFSPTKSRRKREAGSRYPLQKGADAAFGPPGLPTFFRRAAIAEKRHSVQSVCKRGWHLVRNVGFLCRDCRKSALRCVLTANAATFNTPCQNCPKSFA